MSILTLNSIVIVPFAIEFSKYRPMATWLYGDHSNSLNELKI